MPDSQRGPRPPEGDRRGARPALPPLIRACHVQPTVAVTAYTTALAVGTGRRWGSLAAGAAALSGQLLVGWTNDYVDRERDRAAGRTDKPIATGEIDAGSVRRAACVAGALCVPLSLLSGWRAATVHGAAVAGALAYDVRLKQTVASAVPYAVAFGALPAFVTLGGPARRRPASWAMVAGSLMGAGAHFLNTLPDLEADATAGVRGLPHRVGSTWSLVIGVGMLASATTVVVLAGRGPLGRVGRSLAGLAAASVAGVIAASAAGRRRLAWTSSLCVAGATVALSLSRSDVL